MRASVVTFVPLIVLALAGSASSAADGPNTLDPRYRHASPAAYERWRDLKYGLRIHWGIYSQYGFEASWPVLKMPPEKRQVYFDSYKRFNPTQFDGRGESFA